tara:strand:- start:150 stop:860 length:711 start_codon:yes stop_codon:yes gene_type:complete
MNKNIIIKAENVAVQYSIFRRFFATKSKMALKDVSFSLYKGESLGVIGRNGAGKSTLLKLLAGVISPDKGQIIHDNVSVSLLSLQVGFDGELSGYDNIYLSALLLGFKKNQVDAILDNIIQFSELEDSIHQAVKTYSTGMRARLGFSIAYQLEPDVLLIDETLGVGDIEFKEKSIAAMKERIRSDQTVILVSHHGPTIKNLCKRAVWIEDGVTRMEGPSGEVVGEYEKFMLTNNKR